MISNIFGKPVFTCGGLDLSKNNKIRQEYLEAIHLADKNDYKALIEFAGK
jgi:hypothetical protein